MKPKLNMTTRGPSRKKVIIPMTKLNAELIMKSAHKHIVNINECLKNSNSDIIADFIYLSNNRIIITMNHLANVTELSRIKNFLKKIDNINPVSIEVLCLPKSKSYMKIVGLPYNSKLGVVTPDFIEGILKEIHLFKDVTLASKPYIIKVSPKSNKVVVWVDIWDFQSSSAAKNIINHCFNIGCLIATIQGTNTNSGIPQCKNCWKWDHSILSCRSHISRCAKCYGAHITKHHREKAWCYMDNKKANRMATKEGEPCPHVFKCMNCKGDHQVDSYSCSYWHNCFNRDWHGRKQLNYFNSQ